ncbi:MAG: Methionine aminopeptidase [Thermoanaerobacterales bacterium 50_218]|nr:MAG: Methionine aminopeptidase [Thermoanaerobacterales bacterium 50_218]HAA90110.1 type I methionyl aminopeptidase [Peptococcaceae bacterium]
MIILKTPSEVPYLRKAGKIVAMTLQELEKYIRPGVTTGELNKIADDFIRRSGARPAFLGYHGFPGSICTSVNNEVVHGIPGERKLKSGDIISIDVGAIYEGYCGDAAATFPVGEISPEVQHLLEVTKKALYLGIEQAVPGNRIGDISAAIQTFVEANGYSVVRDFVGHGIGRNMHEDPQVPNFGKPGHGPRIRPGLAIAIEPMVNMGTHEVMVLTDGWTVVTRDGSLSAHFEHSVLVTKGQPEILTAL